MSTTKATYASFLSSGGLHAGGHDSLVLSSGGLCVGEWDPQSLISGPHMRGRDSRVSDFFQTRNRKGINQEKKFKHRIGKVSIKKHFSNTE